jgi:hypothetical protein
MPQQTIGQYWKPLALKALGDTGANPTAMVLTIAAFIIVVGIVYQRGGKEAVKVQVAEYLKLPVLIAAVVWLIAYGFFLARVVFEDNKRVLSELGTYKNQVDIVSKEQCWMQNITIPTSRDINGVASSSEVVILCNSKKPAPLMLTVEFDSEPFRVSPLLFPSGRMIDSFQQLKGNIFFASLSSPSLLPYQMVVLFAHSADKNPPLAQRVRISPVDPNK